MLFTKFIKTTVKSTVLNKSNGCRGDSSCTRALLQFLEIQFFIKKDDALIFESKSLKSNCQIDLLESFLSRQRLKILSLLGMLPRILLKAKN